MLFDPEALHNKVQSKISDMLNNKEILYQNVPIEYSEKNTKLIKSFLYNNNNETIHQLDDGKSAKHIRISPKLATSYLTINGKSFPK